MSSLYTRGNNSQKFCELANVYLWCSCRSLPTSQSLPIVRMSNNERKMMYRIPYSLLPSRQNSFQYVSYCNHQITYFSDVASVTNVYIKKIFLMYTLLYVGMWTFGFIVSGRGIVSSIDDLRADTTYRITVRATSYDRTLTIVQYQTTFIIYISVSEYPF